jgi:Lon-like ATP-dependent protease
MRLHKALVLLSREREVSKLQQEISAKVEEKMSEAQRKYFLMEQLKSIKKEFGMERDGKEVVISKYRKQLAEYTAIPEEVMTVIESELEKLSSLEMNSSEYNVTRTYLDWLCGGPWGVMSDENCVGPRSLTSSSSTKSGIEFMVVLSTVDCKQQIEYSSV